MSSHLIQGSPEWIQMRKNYIGGSDAPVIMDVSPYKTIHQLWEEKLGVTEGTVENPGTKYGREMEEPARQAYEKFTGNIMAPAVVFHPEKEFMMASLDGLSFDKKMAVEIKNCCEEDHDLAKKGTVPEKYFPQVQHQLAVLGIEGMHYFSFRRGDFALIEVAADPQYIDQLYSEEKKFWSMVQNFKEPSLSDRDYVQFDSEEWSKLASDWRLLKKEMEALSEREDAIRAEFLRLANDRNALGSGVKVTKICRRGAIDYSKVEELKGVDLEKYRKDKIVSWRIS